MTTFKRAKPTTVRLTSKRKPKRKAAPRASENHITHILTPEAARRIAERMRAMHPDHEFSLGRARTFRSTLTAEEKAVIEKADAEEKHALGASEGNPTQREEYMRGLRFAIPGYESLENVLVRAYDQAATGKGVERHGRGLSFDVQPTQVISDLLQSDAGLAFQAIKKINEGMRLPLQPKVKEMLGAIVYIASLIIYSEAHDTPGFDS